MKTRQVGDGRNFLQTEELRQLRSIVAEQEAPTTSSVYHFFSTEHILNSLVNAGWLPVLAQEMAIKAVAREGFQKHMIRFRQAGTAMKQVGNDQLNKQGRGNPPGKEQKWKKKSKSKITMSYARCRDAEFPKPLVPEKSKRGFA